MRGRLWSVDEERQLRSLVAEGRNLRQICEALGKSRGSVKGKVFNLGLRLGEETTGRNLLVATVVATTGPEVIPPNLAVIDGAGQGADHDLDSKEKLKMGETSLQLRVPKILPSVEEQLKVMAAALEMLSQPGLSHSEIMRLHDLNQGITKYNEHYAKYLNYREIEKEILALRDELAKERARRNTEKKT